MSRQDLKQAQELLRNGDQAKAGDFIKKHLREDPNDPAGWFMAYHATNNLTQKRSLLGRALQADPNFAPAKRELAKLDQSQGDLLFDDYDDDPLIAKQKRVQQKKKSGGNNCLTYAIVGIVAMIVACGGTIFVLNNVMTNFVEEVFSEVDWESIEGGSYADNTGVFQQHGWEVIQKGSINIGGTVNNTVDTFDDDGWLLEGTAGQTITIDAAATDGQLDTELFIYAPSGQLIAENDDIVFMDNTNSRVTITLPETGIYGVVVSAFGSGGSYQLSVR